MCTDEIARQIFDDDKAKVPIHPKVFQEGTAAMLISVDWMSSSYRDALSQLGHQAAIRRKRSAFHGWAVVKAASVREKGRTLCSAPVAGHPELPDNPYHAEIHLNISPDKDEVSIRKEWKQHTRELAAASEFVPSLPREETV